MDRDGLVGHLRVIATAIYKRPVAKNIVSRLMRMTWLYGAGSSAGQLVDISPRLRPLVSAAAVRPDTRRACWRSRSRGAATGAGNLCRRAINCLIEGSAVLARSRAAQPDQPATSGLREPGRWRSGGRHKRLCCRQPAVHHRRLDRRSALAFASFPRLPPPPRGTGRAHSQDTPAASAEARRPGCSALPSTLQSPSSSATPAACRRRRLTVPSGRRSPSTRRCPAIRQSGPGRAAAAALAEAGYPDAARPPPDRSVGPPAASPAWRGGPAPQRPWPDPRHAEHSTTVITFLYFRPAPRSTAQTAERTAYVHWYLSYPSSDVVGVTRAVSADVAQGGHRLPSLGGALHRARHRRDRRGPVQAVGAPLVTLACAGTAYLPPAALSRGPRSGSGLAPADVDPSWSSCCSGDHRLRGVLPVRHVGQAAKACQRNQPRGWPPRIAPIILAAALSSRPARRR